MDDNTEEKTVIPSTPPATEDVQLHEGEKAFQIILFIFGLIAFGLSLNLLGEITGPKISSAAALPLFVSGSWTLLALSGIWENRKLKTPLSNSKDVGANLKAGLSFAMPKDTAVLILCVFLYCLLLYFKLSFYIATAIFLFVSMCYLHKQSYARNGLYTALILAFIIVVFRILFGVVFP